MSAQIKVLKPIPLTDALLISSNVPETDYSAWNSGTTYAKGDRVIVVAEHKVYESLQAANTNKTPATEDLWWIEASPTNRWKAFDTSISSKTAQATSITYKIRPAVAINGIGILGVVNASTINVKLTDPTYGVVFDKTFDMSLLPTVPEWWAWFFGQRVAPEQAVALNIPTYPAADIDITINGGANLAVGTIIFGQVQYIGLGARYGARAGITDYSRKEVNDFGDTILAQRAYAKRTNLDLILTDAEVDAVQKYFTSIRATPCLFVGSEKYEALAVFGFYKQFEILITYPNISDCSLEIEGMT